MTALHIAVRHGHIAVVNYFLASYPPREREYAPIYITFGSRTALSLALDSNEPEMVELVLENSLATTEDVHSAWARVSSGAGLQQAKSPPNVEKAGEIRRMLRSFAGLTPPTPTVEPPPKMSGQTPAREGSVNGATKSDATSKPSVQPQKGRQRPSHERKWSASVNGDIKSGQTGEVPRRGKGGHRGRGRGRGRS